MKYWEKLAQKAMLEPDPKKALDLYNEARAEAIKAKDMNESVEIKYLGDNKYAFEF